MAGELTVVVRFMKRLETEIKRRKQVVIKVSIITLFSEDLRCHIEYKACTIFLHSKELVRHAYLYQLYENIMYPHNVITIIKPLIKYTSIYLYYN